MSLLSKKNLNILFLVGLGLLISDIQAKDSSPTLEELMADLQTEAPIAVKNEATVAEPTKQSSKTLEQLLAELQKEAPIKAGVSTAAVTTNKKESSDRYVQTEAHLQLEDVQFKMADFLQVAIGTVPKKGETLPEPKTPNEMVTPYLNIVAKAINREVKFKDTHYVFYHGMSNVWRVVQDLFKQLYSYYNPLQPVRNFTFLRFTDMRSIKAQDYLQENVSKYAGVNDTNEDVRNLLLPVNLALFGNVGFPGECTWNYFLSPKSHMLPYADNLKPILEKFNLSYDLHTLKKEIEELANILVKASSEQTILQIFIPQEKVDDIAYLAWILGFPAHPKSMALMENMFESRPKVGGETFKVVTNVMKMYKDEGTDNPLYRELVEAVDNGDFGPSAYLKVFRNNPSELKNSNAIQARLVITSDGLLDPKSGIKFFSYFTTPRKIQGKYLKMLNELVKKIIRTNEEKAENAADKEKENEEGASEEI